MTTQTSDTVYDAAEASGILAQTRNNLSLEAQVEAKNARSSEAGRLLKQVLTLLQASGFQAARNEGEDLVVILPRVGSVQIRDEAGGILVTGIRKHPPGVIQWHPAELDFDPVTLRFEGREADTRYVPVPAERVRKRSALAVVAELVDKCMRESAAS
jgi:hypothetical protein